MQLISIRILIATANDDREVYRRLQKSPGTGRNLYAARTGLVDKPEPLLTRAIRQEKRFSRALAKWTANPPGITTIRFFKRETKFYLTTVHEHG
jgi:hypothetical protein